MTNLALVPTDRDDNIPATLDEIQTYAALFAKSGYFQDAREMAQAAVRIIAGKELGIAPFAAMNGIYIIKGRTSLSANLMAQLIKRSRMADGSRRYDYRVLEMTDTNCSIDFYECGEKLGNSAFSIKDAQRAETQNIGKFPRNMLFARAMSNGVKWYCPDLGMGTPLYTPEDLGATVDEQGQIIDVPSRSLSPHAEPKQAAAEPKQPPVDLAALRKQFVASWKQMAIKPNPHVIAKVLHLSEEATGDCFDAKGAIKIKDLGEEELRRLIYYAEHNLEIQPPAVQDVVDVESKSVPDERDPFEDDKPEGEAAQ